LTTASRGSGFDRFQLHPHLVRGLADAGFHEPRPIQVEALPAALEGRDVLGLAQTGTGKTAAFALPVLDWLLDEDIREPAILVLAPTRELAQQIDAEIRLLAKHTRIRTTTVFGGTPQRKQVQALRRGPEIIVGCPGRVLDLLQQGVLDLSSLETLVLDEADHMFDMGFLPDIRKILSRLPADRQNLMFSATMPRAIRQLADTVLHQPHVVELAPARPAALIDHALYPVAEGRKKDLLARVLAEDDCGSAIVFTRTKHRAKRLAQQLDRQGHRAVALQGNMSQPQRDRAMQGFRGRDFDILVATDIAARGIDVADIDYVINFDPPNTPETYTHRIGRTGRSEAHGKACTFVTRDDRDWVHSTEKVLGKSIPRRSVPGIDAEELGAAVGERGRGAGRPAPGRRRRGDGSEARSSRAPRSGRGAGRGSRPKRRADGGGERRAR